MYTTCRLLVQYIWRKKHRIHPSALRTQFNWSRISILYFRQQNFILVLLVNVTVLVYTSVQHCGLQILGFYDIAPRTSLLQCLSQIDNPCERSAVALVHFRRVYISYIVKGVLYSGVLMVGRIVVRQNSQSLVSSLQRISTLKRNTRIVHFQSTLVFKIGLKHADVHFLCGENAVLHDM